ncbi:uncharacterized protein LOC127122784 [Lathyrus oleraceus]|uniref:uncharacterized protein LOC127122784 n=1 Tax=Pisum sativum TaxID=3888 RepID=UPI0021D2DDA4|nr:uncharacterized protein LOC127122784 [Pisum sativum]
MYVPVVSNAIPATIPITTVVTTDATTDFDMSSRFPYSFGHPYGPPHGFQGFTPPELSQGFPAGPFSPYGPYGPQPLVSQPLTSQYYGANPYGAQLSMPMGNPGYTVSPAVMVTYPLQEEPIDLYHGPSIHSETAEDAVQGQIQALIKKLNALQGKDIFGKKASEMCLIPNVRVPAKFKVPEFEKYKSSTCPHTHLVMYCRKMVACTDDEKLLIHYFQDSLSGAPLRWYMSLERANIQTFIDLVEAFVQHYKYNLDMVPDHTQLGNMSQKNHESFKEYEQRWREVASEVTLLVEEKELCKLFLKILDSFYYNKFISSMHRDFIEIVGVGVQLKEGVK